MSDELIQIETPFAFNEDNQREFDELIGRYPIKEAAMLPTLHIAQKQAGYITPAVMKYVAEQLEVSVMKVKDVVTFYPMFFRRTGRRVRDSSVPYIALCLTGLQSCFGASSRRNWDTDVASETNLAKGTTADGKFTLMKVECLASCDVAPVIMVNDDLHKNLTPEKVDELLAKLAS